MVPHMSMIPHLCLFCLYQHMGHGGLMPATFRGYEHGGALMFSKKKNAAAIIEIVVGIHRRGDVISPQTFLSGKSKF